MESLAPLISHVRLCQSACMAIHGPLYGKQRFARSSPALPAYGCSLNSRRGYQGQLASCSSGFLRRNFVPRGTAVSLKDLHVLMLTEEILNDLLTKQLRAENVSKSQ